MTSNNSVPVGTHAAVLAQSFLTTTSTGKAMLSLAFEVEGYGRVSWHGFFTDRAVEMTKRALAALGFDLAAEGYDLNRINDTDLLVGRPAQIVVEDEEDEKGNVHTRVRWVNRPVQKLREGDVSALSASLRKQAEAAKEQAEAQAAESGTDTPF